MTKEQPTWVHAPRPRYLLKNYSYRNHSLVWLPTVWLLYEMWRHRRVCFEFRAREQLDIVVAEKIKKIKIKSQIQLRENENRQINTRLFVYRAPVIRIRTCASKRRRVQSLHLPRVGKVSILYKNPAGFVHLHQCAFDHHRYSYTKFDSQATHKSSHIVIESYLNLQWSPLKWVKLS